MATQVTLNSGSVDSAGSLALKTNGTTTAVTIDTSQNVSAVGSLGTTISSKTAEFNAAGGSIYASYGDGTKTWRTGVGIFAAGQFSIRNATDSLQAIDITSAGNVGIGTSSPANKLDVQGVVSALYSFESTGAVQANSANKIAMSLESASVGRIAVFGTDSSTFGTTVFSRAKSNGGTTESMRIDSSGNLLVGTTTAVDSAYKVQIRFASGGGIAIRTDTNGDNAMGFRNASGTTVGGIVINASTTAYNTSSDYRLKNDIQPMQNALATVAQLKPVTYKWKVDGSAGEGFIAHELQEVVPECVTGEKDAVDAEGSPVYQGVDTSFLVATLTAAIQEQQALITTLTDRITALEAK